MNTADHDDDAQVENDPTGVRALLSSLPDPGPMPDTVFARISASLQEEQERREQQAAFGHDSSPGLISLAAERHRRRPMRTLTYLGAAAGLAVAATVVSTQLFGPGDGGGAGISADVGTNNSPADSGDEGGADAGAAGDLDEGGQMGGQDDEAAEDGAETPADAPAEGESVPPFAGQGEPEPTADSPVGVVATDEVTLGSTDFAEDVSRWYTQGPATADLEGSDLGDCVDTLGSAVPGGAELLLAPGSLDGAPVVLVLQTDPAPQVAWALDTSCADGIGEILQGPSVIP